jgi:hypothetical protein
MVIGSKSVGMKIQDGCGMIHTFCFRATRVCQFRRTSCCLKSFDTGEGWQGGAGEGR